MTNAIFTCVVDAGNQNNKVLPFLSCLWNKARFKLLGWAAMAVSMKNVDPRFQGIGQKVYPYTSKFHPKRWYAWFLKYTYISEDLSNLKDWIKLTFDSAFRTFFLWLDIGGIQSLAWIGFSLCNKSIEDALLVLSLI